MRNPDLQRSESRDWLRCIQLCIPYPLVCTETEDFDFQKGVVLDDLRIYGLPEALMHTDE